MIVFAGPSIAGLEAAALHGLDLRPPAQQGDIYLATQDAPEAIGLIDGYFEGVPSVWHKEILWALHHGIAVLGASSMGALRAAELDAFGMTGVGAIYEAYRDGVLEDDDEVALLHGPPEVNFAGLTLAMVNLRATLHAARVGGVVTQVQTDMLTAEAKAQFYKHRTWASVLAAADCTVLCPSQCQILRDWLVHNEIDQKRTDAVALLEHLQRRAFSPPAVAFPFEHTALWDRATHLWRGRTRRPAAARAVRSAGLSFLDE